MMCTHHCGTDNGGHCAALLICCMICCAHNIVLTFHILSHIISSLVANWDILSSKTMIFQTFLWTNLLLALASSMLCVYWMPSAAGSGIPGKSAFVLFYHVHMFVQCEVLVIWILHLFLHCIHLLALAHIY